MEIGSSRLGGLMDPSYLVVSLKNLKQAVVEDVTAFD